MTIVEFLQARYDEDEAWAREASRDGDRFTPAGARWQWECTDDDTVVVPEPMAGEILAHGDHWAMGLRSVEHFPTSASYTLPQFALPTVEEVPPAVAGHIARHDPARVLREVEAKRRILDLHPHGRFASLPEEWPEHWRAEIKQALPGTAEPYVGCERDAFNHDYEVIEPAWWCETVLLLALPHSDHPDYDPTWSPT